MNYQGKVEIQGTPAELYKKDVDLAELVGMVGKPQVKDNSETFSRQNSKSHSIRSSSSTSLNNTEDGKAVKMFDDNIKDRGVQMEASSKGKVKGSISVNYFKAGGHWFILLILLFSFLFVQFLASATDYWVSVW